MLSFLKSWLQAALAALSLLTIGLFSPRLRSYLRRFAAEVGVRKPAPSPFPLRSPDSIGDASAPVAVPDLEAREGNVSLLELTVLARLVRAARPMTLWEIGTFDGRTTRALAANAPEGAQVHTLDLPASQPTRHALAGAERSFVEKSTSGARFHGTAEQGRITQHFGDSASFDFSPWSGRTDFVFVDGSHAAAYVRTDTARAHHLTEGRRCMIVWHDYGEWPDVTAVLHEVAPLFPGAYRVAGTTLVVWEGGAA